ncbi:Aminodeoxychorismate lyase [Purpureocillium takamizusanense]|uniref:Aminodeoxychorismate lyase n=1 Tax=Purpureocillium takamizusanense TaxID=2060973 RepID=A0A9Q8Q937_9HYPO|nr:Aminodeoxychorismate lyase [Purpureocillium takamizusanense]UNI15833.1 Aminodeoxychorismate lyase [Purpureocillium takamizusanense]
MKQRDETSPAAMEVLLRQGTDSYAAKQYAQALKQFTRAMNLCPCHRGVKRPRCICKDFEGVAEKGGSIFKEAMYTCVCEAGKVFSKCANPLHIKALDYRAGIFETMKDLGRAKKDAEWMLELAPRMPDGYLRLGKITRLLKKPEYALKIYRAGAEAATGQAAGSSEKLQQLHDMLKPMEDHFKRCDPLWLPPEIVHQVLSYLDFVELTKCMRVSKTWAKTLEGRGSKKLWSLLNFSRRGIRTPSHLALQKLVGRAQGTVREIEVRETGRFQLTPQKLDTLLRSATTNLERLALGPLLNFNYNFLTSFEFEKLRHLAAVTYMDRSDGNRNVDDKDHGNIPIGMIDGVANSLEYLDLLGVPLPWYRVSLPMFPKLKYARLEHREKLRQAAFPIFAFALHTPQLEQLSLQFMHLTIGHFWQAEPAWEKLWNNIKVFVYTMPVTGGAWQHRETTAALSMMMSVNQGTTFQYFDHDITYHEGGGNCPARLMTTTFDWSGYTNGDLSSLPVVGHASFPAMREFRVTDLVHMPCRLQVALQLSMSRRLLHTFDIVFAIDDPRAPVGVEHVDHLKQYAWLRGLESIRSLGLFNFRFKRYPRKDEDLPIPGFLATFPNLETLSLGSECYEDEEFCFVVEAIMKATQLKTIYQQNISGAAWDRLVQVGKRNGVQIISGERPKAWPVVLDE